MSAVDEVKKECTEVEVKHAGDESQLWCMLSETICVYEIDDDAVCEDFIDMMSENSEFTLEEVKFIESIVTSQFPSALTNSIKEKLKWLKMLRSGEYTGRK